MQAPVSQQSMPSVDNEMPTPVSSTVTTPANQASSRLNLFRRLMTSRLLRQASELAASRHGNKLQANGLAGTNSSQGTRVLSTSPSSYTCKVTTSRYLVPAAPTNRHMTIDSCGRRVQQQPTVLSMMEALVPSPARLEVIPTSEAFGSGGQEPYAASPNSLYMYEQEKSDMMNFDPANPSVPSPSFLSQAEEFDLKPQFENSNTLDISNMTPTNNYQQLQSNAALWRCKDTMQYLQAALDQGLRTDKTDMSAEPTLNELNLDDSILDDLNLESLLQNVDTSMFASGAPSPIPDSKPASGVATPVQENLSPHSTPLLTVLGASRALDSLATQSNGHVPVSTQAASMGAMTNAPVYTATVTVKHEPFDPDYESAEQGGLLHRLLVRGTAMTEQRQTTPQQHQQPQQPLGLPPSYNSRKSMPTPSRTPCTTAPSSSLPPLRLRGMQSSSSFRPVTSVSSSSPTGFQPPRLKLSPSSTPVLKQEPAACGPCHSKAVGGPSAQPGPMHRGLKRTMSSQEEDSQNTMERKWNEIVQFIGIEKTESEGNPQAAGGSGYPPQKKVRHASDNSNRTSSIDASSEVDTDDDDSDNDLDSDLEDYSINPGEMGESLLEDKTSGSGKKKERQYFWQYNVQAKGPKGTRLRLLIDNTDPHELHHFEDPVFDPENTLVAGIRHGGKARKGDGNEVTPNPKKFYQIGLQIRRLNRQITELGNTNDMPAPQRNSSRKLKNKLASRACRLKKKAQHEANKVKLFGLEQEHKRLMYVLATMNRQLYERAAMLMKRQQTGVVDAVPQKPLTTMYDDMIHTHLAGSVAGNGVDFVNSVITKVESGDWTGGLSLPKSKG